MKDDTTALERQVIAEALSTPPDARMAMFAALPPGTFYQYLHNRLASIFAKDPNINTPADLASAVEVGAHEVEEIAGDRPAGLLINVLCLLLNERFTEAAKQKLDTHIWAETIVAVHAATRKLITAKARSVVVASLESFQAKEFPPAVDLLSPIIHENSLNMVFASRGRGKTFFALSLAMAIATGGRFLRWEAKQPRKVLYIDGEMPAVKMQERLARIATMPGMGKYIPEYFNIITPDLQLPDMPMPDLSTTEGQAAIDAIIPPDTALIVVDNLSCMCRTGRENESESWLPVQGWALKQRRNGRAVLFVHHAGKNGEQRGAGKKEDLLDVVIELRKPADIEGQGKNGASFELHFSKGRHLEETDKQPLIADLTTSPDGAFAWAWTGKKEDTFHKIIAMANDGMKQFEIAQVLGISKQAVHKHWKQGETEGLIDPPKTTKFS